MQALSYFSHSFSKFCFAFSISPFFVRYLLEVLFIRGHNLSTSYCNLNIIEARDQIYFCVFGFKIKLLLTNNFFHFLGTVAPSSGRAPCPNNATVVITFLRRSKRNDSLVYVVEHSKYYTCRQQKQKPTQIERITLLLYFT